MFNRLKTAFLALLLLPLVAVGQELVWEDVAQLLMPRRGHAAAVGGGRIYVFGGITRGLRAMTSSVEVYEPEANRWREVESLPEPLYKAAAVTAGGYIYIFGGITDSGKVSDRVYGYDIRQNRVSRVAQMPEPRSGMAAVTVGRLILLMGGNDEAGNALSDGYWCIPDSARWDEAQPFTGPRTGFGMAAWRGSVWAVGGIFISPIGRLEALIEGRWVERRPMRTSAGSLGAAFLGDTLVVAGGATHRSLIQESVSGYLPGDDEWIELPDMNHARSDFTLVSLDGLIYAIGGLAERQQGGRIHRSVEMLRYRPVHVQPSLNTPVTDCLHPAWPNPTNGPVNFMLPMSPARVRIINSRGQTLSDIVVSGGSWSWNSTPYPAGSYLYVVTSPSGKITFSGLITVVK